MSAPFISEYHTPTNYATAKLQPRRARSKEATILVGTFVLTRTSSALALLWVFCMQSAKRVPADVRCPARTGAALALLYRGSADCIYHEPRLPHRSELASLPLTLPSCDSCLSDEGSPAGVGRHHYLAAPFAAWPGQAAEQDQARVCSLSGLPEAWMLATTHIGAGLMFFQQVVITPSHAMD